MGLRHIKTSGQWQGHRLKDLVIDSTGYKIDLLITSSKAGRKAVSISSTGSADCLVINHMHENWSGSSLLGFSFFVFNNGTIVSGATTKNNFIELIFLTY